MNKVALLLEKAVTGMVSRRSLTSPAFLAGSPGISFCLLREKRETRGRKD